MPSFAVPIIAITISLAPFAIFLALKRPLVFPLGLYILMVPFDGLLGTSATPIRVIEIAAAIALLFHMLITRRVLAPPKSWTGWAIIMLMSSLTALWTIDPPHTLASIGLLLQLFLFFSILAIYPAERNDVRVVGAIVVASGALLALFGLASYLQGGRTQGDRLSVFFNGVLLDPNHIAAALLLPIALAVGTLLETRDLRLRLSSAIAAIVMVTALFLTGSRGGLIALTVMFLYLAWKTRYRLQILALIAIGGVGSLLMPTVWARFADKGLEGGSGRLFIWNAGGLALKDHWVLGAGFGAFPAAYNHELLAMYQPIFQGWSRPAHNALLSAAVELGIAGAVLVAYAWWQSWNDARGNIALEASLIGLATASFFLDVILFKYIWLAFSMAVLAKNAAEPKFLRGARRQPKPSGRRRFKARVLPWRRRQLVVSAARSQDTA
jgi:O-antigen ligase